MPIAAEKITDSLTEDMPDVQEHAIDAEKAKEAEGRSLWEGIVDRFNNPASPETHQANPDGSPKLSKKDRAMLKPGLGKSSGPSIVGAPPSKSSTQFSGQPEQQDEGDPRGAAMVTVDSIEMVGMLISPQFQYIKSKEHNIDERERGYEAWEKYYRAKGVQDIPPGVAITIWSLAYIMPRLRAPEVTNKWAKVKEWVAIKILKRRINKEPKDDNE